LRPCAIAVKDVEMPHSFTDSFVAFGSTGSVLHVAGFIRQQLFFTAGPLWTRWYAMSEQKNS
jgi:hypothetical protein